MKRLAKKLKRKLLKIAKQWVKYWALNRLLPRAYAKAAQAPVAPDKVVFVENKQADLSDSYKVIYERLTHDYTFDVRFVSLGQNRVRFKKYFRNCEAMLQEIATAKYVFLNDASDVVSCVDLRPETKVVQLWHACGAFKKWGMSTADLIFGGSRKDLLRHPFYKNLSLVTVSSPEVEWAYREAMVLEDRPQVVQPLGVSRTDLFFDSDYLAGMRERIEQLVPECAGKKIILYAPTFRGRVAKAEGPDQLNIRAMKQALGDEYVLMIKHHPFVKNLPPIPDDCQDFAFQMSGGIAAIDQLLTVADVCISDYSSLVFEYSLFERPMIFFAYDLADYGDWRGFYYDYDQLTPGPVLTDTAQIIDYVQHLDVRFDKQEVVNFKQRFMSACDGHATDRICQAVFGEDLQVYRRPTTAEVLRAQNPDGKDISIIIPAYNAMPFIAKSIASVLFQTYSQERMEIIIVDDCSTDGTWDCLQEYQRGNAGVVKCFQLKENSGSGAVPRNKGLEAATGTYIFFLDADDWLAPEAVECMLDHAVDWNSDVLVAKMVGEGGRKVPSAMFTGNYPQVDIYTSKVMWTFGPTKLFRRSLIEENNLRFPHFMPEDISFVLRAYVYADIVSVASDYDYYHCNLREAYAHSSFGTWNKVETNLKAFRDIFGFIDAQVPDECRDADLMRRLFRRDGYLMSMSIAKNYSGGTQKQLYDQMKELFAPYYRPGNYLTCRLDKRLVLDAAMLGDLEMLQSIVGAGGTLISKCAFVEDEGRTWCVLPDDICKMRIDATDAAPFKYSVDRVCAVGDASLSFRGDLRGLGCVCVESMAIRAVRRIDNACIEVPCTISRQSVESVRDADGLETPWLCYLWDATFEGTLIEEAAPLQPAGDNRKAKNVKLKESWDLFLVLRLGAATWLIRFGTCGSLAARRSFLTVPLHTASADCTPRIAARGNFCYGIKRDA